MDCTVVLTTVGGPYLEQQLDALVSQTRPPSQIVLVNNGRPGVLAPRIDPWRARLPQLALLEDQDAQGCGYARNRGAAQATSPGLLFVDDDDVVEPGYVEAMSAALDGARLVGARIDVDRLNPAVLAREWAGTQRDGLVTYLDFLPWSFGGACGIHRELFESIGGFDVTLTVGEDTELCWRAQLEAGAEPAFVPDAVVAYRLRTTPRSVYRQAVSWALWDVVLMHRYRDRLPPRPHQARALLRWLRPLQVLLAHRDRTGLILAAAKLGGCVGRAQGSWRVRRLYL